jgi:hypothetical protein
MSPIAEELTYPKLLNEYRKPGFGFESKKSVAFVWDVASSIIEFSMLFVFFNPQNHRD